MRLFLFHFNSRVVRHCTQGLLNQLNPAQFHVDSLSVVRIANASRFELAPAILLDLSEKSLQIGIV